MHVLQQVGPLVGCGHEFVYPFVEPPQFKEDEPQGIGHKFMMGVLPYPVG